MTDRQLYLIDQYHQGKLSKAEQTEFDGHMEDAEFAKVVQLGSELKTVSKITRAEEIRKKIQSWEATPTSTKSKWSNYLVPLLILGVLVFAFVGYRACQTEQEQTPQMLYASYLKPYKNIYLPVARSEDQQSLPEQAMMDYENGQYLETIAHFDAINANDLTVGDRFFLAVSYILTDQTDQAIPLLESLQTDDKYGIPAKWYLFLSAVKSSDEARIEQLGNELSQQTSHAFIANQSRALLEALE